MRAYVGTTGVIFALVVAVHIWRAVVEGMGLARDPGFIAMTLAAALLSVWATVVFRSRGNPS